MTAAALKVVTLYDSNVRDPAATLRVIADEMDAGRYGAVGCVALAILGDTLTVHAAGPDSDSTSAACVLHAGFNKLIKPIEEHGR